LLLSWSLHGFAVVGLTLGVIEGAINQAERWTVTPGLMMAQ